MREINVGMTITPGLYRHTKSEGLYTVFCLVRHHETGNPMVVYYSHGHGSVSTRPLHGFTGTRCSDPDGFEERFVLITDRPGSVGQPPLEGVTATVLWTSDTLLRNFGLFAEAIAGVGLRAIDPTRAEASSQACPACGSLLHTRCFGNCEECGTPLEVQGERLCTVCAREETPDARLATAVTSLERALEVLRKEQFERAGAKKTPM